MTRETRIALLVGMAFIILFGLVLGERSLRLSREPRPQSPPPRQVRPHPAPEVMAVSFERTEDDALLSPRRAASRLADRSPGPSGQAEGAPGTGVSSQHSEPGPAPRPRPATYKVQPGDTLIRIARKLWGREHEGKYTLIFQANRDKLKDASTLSPGQELAIPALQETPRPAPPPPPARPTPARYTEVTLGALAQRFGAGQLYTVRAGDSLPDIARREMGDDSRETVWKLYEANRERIRDPNELPAGLKLRIPG